MAYGLALKASDILFFGRREHDSFHCNDSVKHVFRLFYLYLLHPAVAAVMPVI